MFAQCKTCAACPVLHAQGWTRGDDEVRHLDIPVRDVSNARLACNFDVALIFASANNIRSCPECRETLSSTFAIPRIWWDDCYRKANGFFGRQDSVDLEGRIAGISTWSRFMTKQIDSSDPDRLPYHWPKFNIYTRWLPDARQAILVFDALPEVRQALSSRLLDGAVEVGLLRDPFWAYIGIAHELVSFQHRAVWTMRTLIRETEKRRTREDNAGPNFPWLHDLARHAIHISETMDAAALALDDLLSHHKQVCAMLSNVLDAAADADRDDDDDDDSEKHTGDLWSFKGARTAAAASRAVRNRLLFQNNALRSMLLRSGASRDRLQNEIGLAFNTVAQRNARTSVEIGRAAREDGVAVKTIAFVTLAFLPATFICAVFSMSFFDFSPETGDWAVSDKFWVYWAVTVPVTACTTVAFMWWSRPAAKKTDAGNGAVAPWGALSAGVDNMLAMFGVRRIRRASEAIPGF